MNGLPLPPRFSASDSALFLDFDGTLIGFGPTPDAVEVSDELRALLERLRGACEGALAIVSGRRIETLDALLAPLRLPAAGLHGLERRDARDVLHREPTPPRALLEPVRAALAAFAERDPRLLVEDKGATVALHYRAAPELGAELDDFGATLARDLPGGLRVQRGHRVLEIRPQGADKGSAIAAFLAEAPFAGRHAVFVGDDHTDEHGFAVVNATNGTTVKVGEGATAARCRLPHPAAVQAWLSAGLDRRSRRASA